VHEEWTADGCVFDLELTKPDLDQLTSALYKPTNGDYNFQFGDEATFVNDDAARKKQKKGKKMHQAKMQKMMTMKMMKKMQITQTKMIMTTKTKRKKTKIKNKMSIILSTLVASTNGLDLKMGVF